MPRTSRTGKNLIPTSFQLGGRTWTVVRNVKSKKELGSCSSATCTIKLTTLNRNDEEELHTFYHELLHAIAYTMAWGKFFVDELKIDGVAGLLAQALVTAEYER